MSDAPSIWDSLTPVERARIRFMAMELTVPPSLRGYEFQLDDPSVGAAVRLVEEWLLAPPKTPFPSFVLANPRQIENPTLYALPGLYKVLAYRTVKGEPRCLDADGYGPEDLVR